MVTIPLSNSPSSCSRAKAGPDVGSRSEEGGGGFYSAGPDAPEGSDLEVAIPGKHASEKESCECSKQIGLSLFASSAMTQGPSYQNGPVMHNMFNTLASNYTIYRENSHSTCFQVLNRFTAKKGVTVCHIVLTTSHSDLLRPHKLQC